VITGGCSRSGREQKRAPPANHDLLTVGDVTAMHACRPICTAETTMHDVAGLLIASGAGALTVVCPDSTHNLKVIGFVTEDDILQAYLHCVPWDIKIGEWLQGGGGMSLSLDGECSKEKMAASQSSNIFASMRAVKSVLRNMPLRAAVPQLVGSLLSPKWPHFLFVRAETEADAGVFSSMDLVRALADCTGKRESEIIGALGGDEQSTVADFMEPLSATPSLPPHGTMQQLVHKLLASPSGAVLITDGKSLHGVATPLDAMWAFQEGIPNSQGAWQQLSKRHGQLDSEHRTIAADSPLATAAVAMLLSPYSVSADGAGIMRSLLVFSPSTQEVIGVLSPHNLACGPAMKKMHPELRLPLLAKDISLCHRRGPPTPLAPTHAQSGEMDREHEFDCTQIAPTQLQRARTVGTVALERETVKCSLEDALAHAAMLLLAAGRTAAVIVDTRDVVHGVLTENDLMWALKEGMPADCTIDAWLRGSEARLPGFMVPCLTLPPETELAEAAVNMLSMSEVNALSWSGWGFACHHLLVSGAGAESSTSAAARRCSEQVRLLSALDIAKCMAQEPQPDYEQHVAADATAERTVAEAMRPRSGVPCCYLSTTLGDAFETLTALKQNCALVTGVAEHSQDQSPTDQDGEAHVWGVVTSADAIRAFAENVDIESTILADHLQNVQIFPGATLDLVEYVTKSVRSIESTACLADAAEIMRDTGVHHLLVHAPDSASVVGVLSALDIVRVLGKHFLDEGI